MDNSRIIVNLHYTNINVLQFQNFDHVNFAGAVLKVDGKADCLKFDLALGNALKQFPYKCQLLEKKVSDCCRFVL